MKKWSVLLLWGGLSLAQGQAIGTSPFVDVPPCHWARAAVEAIARPVAAAPQASSLLAENALRQVFEGLKCNDSVWSTRFLQNPAPSFGRAEVPLDGFELQNTRVELMGNRATVRFNLTVAIGGRPVRRSGTALLVFTEAGWKVEYASLANLNLPIFPR